MQCWLTCIVGYIAPTPPLPHGMHNINIFKGFHVDINRYVKYKISVISSHHVGARLLYINEKQTSLYILISKNQALQILPAPCILLLFKSYTTINTPYN